MNMSNNESESEIFVQKNDIPLATVSTLHKHDVAQPFLQIEDPTNAINSIQPRQDDEFKLCRLNKPLIPMKIILYFWFGAGSVSGVFTAVLLKQKGLSVSEISLLFTLASVVQIIMQITLGVLADKTGKYRLVCFVTIMLYLLAINCLLFTSKLEADTAHVICEYSDGGMSNISFATTNSIICSGDCSVMQMQNSTNGYLSDFCDNTSRDILHYNDTVVNPSGNITPITCQLSHTVSWTVLCKEEIQFQDIQNTFSWPDFVLIAIPTVLTVSSWSSVYRCNDIISMNMVNSYNSDFGVLRFWSLLGSSSLTAITGCIVDAFSLPNLPRYVEVAYYMSNLYILVVILGLWRLRTTHCAPSKQMWMKTLTFLKNIDNLSMIAIFLIIGSCFSFSDHLISYYLDDLGASATLQGIQKSVRDIVGIPILMTSRWWINKFGSRNIFVLALFGHSVYYLGISFLHNPWWVLPCQTIFLITYHLLWVTVVTHVHEISPDGLKAVMVVVSGMVHYGGGRICGNLSGGYLKTRYGWRIAFRIFCGIAFGTAVIYSIFLYTRRHFLRTSRLKQTIKKGAMAVGRDLMVPA